MTLKTSTRVIKVNPDPLSKNKGVWIWYAGSVTGANQSAALQLCATNHLTDLHLNFDNTFGQSSQAKYQAFIGAAHAQGLKVHALFGKDTWGTNAGLSECQSWITSVVNFNSSAASGQKFDSISLDNEPYNLKSPNNFFGNNPSVTATMMNEWLNVNTQYVNQAHASSMVIGTSMPSWLSYNDQVLNAINYDPTHLTNYYKKFIDQWDYVAIMDYPLDESAANLINEANQAGIDYPTTQKMWIGIENGNLGVGAADGTLYGNFYMQFETTLKAVDDNFKNHATYAGIMIDKWSALQPLFNGGQIKTPTKPLTPTRIIATN